MDKRIDRWDKETKRETETERAKEITLIIYIRPQLFVREPISRWFYNGHRLNSTYGYETQDILLQNRTVVKVYDCHKLRCYFSKGAEITGADPTRQHLYLYTDQWKTKEHKQDEWFYCTSSLPRNESLYFLHLYPWVITVSVVWKQIDSASKINWNSITTP